MLARLSNPNFQSEVTQTNGFLVYVFKDSHVERAIGSLSYYLNANAPYFFIDQDGILKRDGSFLTGRYTITKIHKVIGRSNLFRRIGFDMPLRITKTHFERTARILIEAKNVFENKFGSNRFFVVLYPDSKRSKWFENRLSKEGIGCLDYSNLFDMKDPKHHLPNDGHPSPLSHRDIAIRLVSDLQTAGEI
jgi:hypothetical protein